tara:strand:- start:47 stop:898 length:852 start_codon:yes stop_codon:yes gene_type:complete
MNIDEFIDCTGNYKLNTENLNSFHLCTPARVGSSTWHNAFRNKYPHIRSYHYHDLNNLKTFFKNNKSQVDRLKQYNDKWGTNRSTELIIVYGIRNPIDHILSNMMIHHAIEENTVRYNNKFMGNFKFDTNLLSNNPTEIIKIMKNNVERYSYITDWSFDFLNIIKYKLNLDFDKDKGFQILRKNNITYIFYRMDKINSFKEQIKEMTELELGHDYKAVEVLPEVIKERNLECNHDLKELYKYIKNTIKFDINYLNNLIDNPLYKYFYTVDERNEMIEKYNENK